MRFLKTFYENLLMQPYLHFYTKVQPSERMPDILNLQIMYAY